MGAVAVALAMAIVRDQAHAARRTANPAGDLTAYNAYFASLDHRGRRYRFTRAALR
jgi:hypothetical protein